MGAARGFACPEKRIVPERLGHQVIVAAGRAKGDVRVHAARVGVLIPASDHLLRGRRHRIGTEDAAQVFERRLDRVLVACGSAIAARGAPCMQH